MILTPIKAIRVKCLDCCCGNMAEVRRCPAEKCSLHPYRMGHRPKMDANTPVEAIGEKCGDSPHIFAADDQKESPLV